jgi:hypothetical protein
MITSYVGFDLCLGAGFLIFEYDVIIDWNRSRIWDVQKLKTKHPNKGQNLHMTLSSIETEVEFEIDKN